jgi:sugar lactone lactonase YvrE
MLKALAAGTALFDAACSGPGLEASAAQQHGVAHPYGELAPTEPSAPPPRSLSAPPPESPIVIENRLPGSAGFQLLNPGNGACEVYCSTTSAAAGEVVDVYVSVDHTQRVRLDLYRIGYYQGLGARLVASLRPVTAGRQAPYYSVDPSSGLVECDWATTFSFEIDAKWVTGYYLIKVTNEAGFEAHVPFILRETGRVAPLLAQASVTTWAAYNLWGELDLYSNLSDRSVFNGPRGYRVSFDRPYLARANVWREEFAMVRFLEQMGYDVAYVSNVDMDRAPELLEARLLFMTVGHDEYWSLEERNAVQAARDNGLSLAFFSGNTAYRRIRLESSSQGVERRVVTCYKSATLDPHADAPDTTADFASAPYARPENELLGLKWAGWSHLDGYPFTVSDPHHWIYEGTGVRANEAIGHIIGYEWDVVGDNGLTPAGLEVIGRSPALHEYAYISQAEASVYYPTPTSFVFAAGTIAWSRALGEPEEVDARLQRATENILKRAQILPKLSVVVPAKPAPERGTSKRCYVLAGTGQASHSDGPALSAKFHSPCGIAVGPHGDLFVTDNGSHLIRKISADGQVSTIAGDRDSTTGAHFKDPTGIAVDAAGAVYVADTNNHRIIIITPDGQTARFAGNGLGNDDATDRGEARFHSPRGLSFGLNGALYVADFGNDAIRRIDAGGVTTLVTGCGGPSAVVVDADGTLYFIATWEGSIVRVAADGTRTNLVNPSGNFGDLSGPGTTARLRAADGLALTPSGLIVTDTGNNRVRFVAFDAENTVSTLVGSGQVSADVGTGKTTDVVFPRGVCAFDGGYALSDCLNHRVLWFSV